MPPVERARSLSRKLQAWFRIDLFSSVVERDFERQLAEAIRSAEVEAFRRGQDTMRQRLEQIAEECRAGRRDLAEGIEAVLRSPPVEDERAA